MGELRGAAWATVIGQVVSGVLVIVYFWKFRNMYLTGAMLKPKMPYLKAIISLGLASCINQIAMAIVQIVLNNILRHYGADSVYGSDIPIACVGVISKVNQMFYGNLYWYFSGQSANLGDLTTEQRNMTE